jgi:hypothetical protein
LDKPQVPAAPAPVLNGVGAWDDRARLQPHPLANPKFPYRVKILVGGHDRIESEQTHLFRGNDLFVQLAPGETFEIGLENRTRNRVFLRLLVDGMNTLAEPVKAADGSETLQPCQQVLISRASAWQLPANSTAFAEGFYGGTKAANGNSITGRKFTVVHLKDSVLHRDQYDDQIGLITAGFYASIPKQPPAVRTTRSGPGPLGIDPGDPFEQKSLAYDDSVTIGDLIATVNIHYVLPEVLKELKK